MEIQEKKVFNVSTRFCAVLLLVGPFLTLRSYSQEVPRTMTKITTKIIEPKPESGSFEAQEKVWWRAGTKYARVAEAPDPKNHIHGLAIIKEPDVWMINLFEKSGRHSIDPGPTFNVHLPIFPEPSGNKMKVNELEFGNEVEFFQKNDAKQTSGELLDGKTTIRHDLILGDIRVVLWTDAKSKKPVRISLVQSAQRETIAYVAYDDELVFDPTLFLPPTGIAVVDSK